MNLTLVLKTDSALEIQNIVRKSLLAKSFFGLRGDLGAGKTTFIAGLLEHDNVIVASPTFALYHSYQTQDLEIIHADLYRLKDAGDIESSGFWDLFANENSAILTEWIDRIKLEELPLNWNKWILEIIVEPNFTRVYSLYRLD